MTIYDMPNLTQSDGLLGMMQYVNTVSDGIFFPLILLAIGIIIFLTSLNVTEASKSFTFTCFILFVLSIPLGILGVLAPKYMYMSIIMLALGVFWTWMTE